MDASSIVKRIIFIWKILQNSISYKSKNKLYINLKNHWFKSVCIRILLNCNKERVTMDREDCPVQKLGYEYFEKVVNMIGGKWKLRVLYIVGLNKVLSLDDLEKSLDNISHDLLLAQLKELEEDALIVRKEQFTKVEISLSKKGFDLLPMLLEMCNWVLKYEVEKFTAPEDEMFSTVK